MAAYAASKAAVRNHTKSVALYCAAQGLPVRCNSVHPAAVRTPMWDAMLGPPDAPDRAAREAEMVRAFDELPAETDRVIFFPRAAGGAR